MQAEADRDKGNSQNFFLFHLSKLPRRLECGDSPWIGTHLYYHDRSGKLSFSYYIKAHS